MKLCVTSTGRTLDSRVDERFGRASYFLVIDTETMNFEAVSNTAQAAGSGAGIAAAQIISDKGASALLTGVVGPNAFSALKTAGIKIYKGASASDTVRDALEKFKRGEYSEASVPGTMGGGIRRGGMGGSGGMGKGSGSGRGMGRL